MYTDLTEEQLKLADLMSCISEEAYCADWMANLEYVLWDATLNGGRKYGRYFITQKDIDQLIALCEITNSWIYFDESGGETAIPVNQWQEKFKRDVKDNQRLTFG